MRQPGRRGLENALHALEHRLGRSGRGRVARLHRDRSVGDDPGPEPLAVLPLHAEHVIAEDVAEAEVVEVDVFAPAFGGRVRIRYRRACGYRVAFAQGCSARFASRSGAAGNAERLGESCGGHNVIGRRSRSCPVQPFANRAMHVEQGGRLRAGEASSHCGVAACLASPRGGPLPGVRHRRPVRLPRSAASNAGRAHSASVCGSSSACFGGEVVGERDSLALSRVLERGQSLGFEHGAIVLVDLEVERVIEDEPEHQAIAEDAVAAKHPTDRHRTEFAEQLGKMVDELAHSSIASSCMCPATTLETPCGSMQGIRSATSSDPDRLPAAGEFPIAMHRFHRPVNRGARLSMKRGPAPPCSPRSRSRRRPHDRTARCPRSSGSLSSSVTTVLHACTVSGCIARDGRRIVFDEGIDFTAGHDLVHEPHPLRLGCSEPPGGEQDLLRTGRSDEIDERAQALVGVTEAELRGGDAEPGIVRGDPQVRAQRDREPAAGRSSLRSAR